MCCNDLLEAFDSLPLLFRKARRYINPAAAIILTDIKPADLYVGDLGIHLGDHVAIVSQ